MDEKPDQHLFTGQKSLAVKSFGHKVVAQCNTYNKTAVKIDFFLVVWLVKIENFALNQSPPSAPPSDFIRTKLPFAESTGENKTSF